MAHICLQRHAELDIVLEHGRELGAVSDGSPVVRDEYRLGGVQGQHCLDLSGVKSLEQRRDNAFGFSWEWKALGHQGSPVRVVELGCGDDTQVVGWTSVRSLIVIRRVAKADSGDQQGNTHTFFSTTFSD